MQERRMFLKTVGLAAGAAALRDITPGTILPGTRRISGGRNPELSPVLFQTVSMGGELSYRAARNFDRLEEERYQLEKDFVSDRYTDDWPGDTEWRTVFGLTLLAQAIHREPAPLNKNKYWRFLITLRAFILSSSLLRAYFDRVRSGDWVLLIRVESVSRGASRS